ncbi:MAG: hypothetical protein HZB79_00900 [Deltaproteobacteria bacterium]|nr:hypothetical protein [Deltaproteobacteria bacterium]
MECPHLETGRKVNVCNVSLTMMSPSIYETNVYCATEEYYRCPILLAHTLRLDTEDVERVQ